ncbi:FAD-binding oxidoreductase [Aureimonas sp. AU40]|uniref:FAD-binding oxidoreductase n=1 Tax=Aureimonas sp. AU40 TaxID=1637747 RepID=UPI000781487E|nr:FAD-binding oxidoreductase [Aureimonas sp. AU40]
MSALLDALRGALGAEFVIENPADRERYEHGARYDKGQCLAVLRPADTVEVAACLRLAAESGVRIIPQGANTGLVGGSTPDGAGRDLVLSLERLKSFAFDIDNASVRVGAGLLLSDLNARLEPEGMVFPIDLGADPSIGGMIATNTGGARFLRHGDVRANVLGLTAVLPDGRVVRLGGGVRKNNTGPDWKHLLIGTSGAFGVVTEAELRVSALPRETAVALLVPAAAEAVLPVLRAMERRFGPMLSAFEGMSSGAVEAALAHVPALRNPFSPDPIPDYAMLVEIARTMPALEGEVPLEDLLQSGLAALMEEEPDLLLDARFGPPERGWALRHALSEGVKAAGKLIAFDLGFRRGQTMPFRLHMQRELARLHPEIRVCDFGHFGDGGLHFNLVVPFGSRWASDEAAEKALRDRVIAVAVEEFGGSFSAEHAIGRRNQAYFDAYSDPRLKAWSAAILQTSGDTRIGAARFD